VWEVYDKAKRLPSALGGGGRYDNIIGNFIGSGNYPAVGISFGLEPICAILQSAAQQTVRCVDLVVIPLGTEIAAQQFAETLRDVGVRVLVYLGGKSVGKAFEHAHKEGIPFACVFGENETKSCQVTVKNMATGEQTSLAATNVAGITTLLEGSK
jgi:histidyl-tRNA synthetase